MKGTRMPKPVRSIALLAICLSGCAFFTKAHTHVVYTRASNKLTVTHVAKSGQYALYIDNDSIPAVVQLLKKSQRFGFEENDEGRIRAIAGDYATVLPRDTKAAQWKPLPYQNR
jgi:hypothetical protein